MSLQAASKKSSNAAENATTKIRIMDYIPLHHEIVNVDDTGRLGSNLSLEDELCKLKIRFKAWKKEYRSRLQETKATLHKIGASKMRKSGKKWWDI